MSDASDVSKPQKASARTNGPPPVPAAPAQGNGKQQKQGPPPVPAAPAKGKGKQQKKGGYLSGNDSSAKNSNGSASNANANGTYASGQKPQPPLTDEEKQLLEEEERRLCEQDAKIVEYVEEKTGIKTEEQRRKYWLSSTMEQWYPVVEPLTFKTHFLTMTEKEKLAVLLRYWYPVGEEMEREMQKEGGEKNASPDYSGYDYANYEARRERRPNTSELDTLKQVAIRAGMDVNFNKAADVHVKSESHLRDLRARIDQAIRSHFSATKCVFCKLSSSSPKDSSVVIKTAARELEKRYEGVSKEEFDKQNGNWDKTDPLHDDHLFYTDKWIRFYDERINAQKVFSGEWCLRLLTNSSKVAVDLAEDLLPSGSADSEAGGSADSEGQAGANAESQKGPANGSADAEGPGKNSEGPANPRSKKSQKTRQFDTLKLCLREYDERMTMAREFRIFVFDGQLTGITQSLYIFRIQEILRRKREIEGHIRGWFESHLKPRIDRGELPRHFMVDALWTPDPSSSAGDANAPQTPENSSESLTTNLAEEHPRRHVTLIEINPFDGALWGVFKGSTGIFNIKDARHYLQPDTDQILAVKKVTDDSAEVKECLGEQTVEELRKYAGIEASGSDMLFRVQTTPLTKAFISAIAPPSDLDLIYGKEV